MLSQHTAIEPDIISTLASTPGTKNTVVSMTGWAGAWCFLLLGMVDEDSCFFSFRRPVGELRPSGTDVGVLSRLFLLTPDYIAYDWADMRYFNRYDNNLNY